MNIVNVKSFAADESGAVTVDWVVLTAAIVGIGIAVLMVVAGGINSASEDVNSELTNTTSVASLIGGGTDDGVSYSTAQDYVDNANGDSFDGYQAALADAPEGYTHGGTVDAASGYPVYDSMDANGGDNNFTVSVGGEVSDAGTYYDNNATTHFANF